MTNKRKPLKTKKPKIPPAPVKDVIAEPAPEPIELHQRFAWVWITLLIIAVVTTTIMLKRSEVYVPESLPPPPANALYKQSAASVDVRLNDLMDRMSLDEKIGQMALVDKNSLLRLSDMSLYGIGGVLSGAGAKPKINTPKGWLQMIGGYKTAALKSRLQIPLMYGLDANHGHTNIPGATVYPHFIGLGASGDADLVNRVARATAEELDATGVNWSFSPNLDAPNDIRWGRTYEAFSDNPQLNAGLGAAYIKGLQESGTKQTFVMGTAKHYVGAGSMIWGQSEHHSFKIDQGTTAADELALINEYLPPFAAASQADVASVMVGLHNWGNQKVIISPYLITDKLKNEVGFEGIVVSDWYGVYERAGNKYNATVKAINAGVDMVMLPYNYKTFVKDVHHAVLQRDIPTSRIDDAARRILRQKFKAGLFEKQLTDDSELYNIGSATHRALAREAVAKSAVLLKNENVLPIDANNKTIYVAGSGADNVGRQSGAWTVEWQGIDGNWLPGGISILDGIKEQAGSSASITYEKSAQFSAIIKADVGIVVVSEKPYAEGWGDNPNPTIEAVDLDAIARMRTVSNKLLVIIVSGRPFFMNELQNVDALVAVWLPGSEGNGVADVLFGKAPFSGKLPLPWPASAAQLPISSIGKTADGTVPSFPRGFGLTNN